MTLIRRVRDWLADEYRPLLALIEPASDAPNGARHGAAASDADRDERSRHLGVQEPSAAPARRETA
jgi:hypothetical protein